MITGEVSRRAEARFRPLRIGLALAVWVTAAPACDFAETNLGPNESFRGQGNAPPAPPRGAMSSEAAPAEALSGERLSSSATSKETLSGERLSSSATSKETLSGEPVSGERLSSNSMSGEPLSSGSMSGEPVSTDLLSSGMSAEPVSGENASAVSGAGAEPVSGENASAVSGAGADDPRNGAGAGDPANSAPGATDPIEVTPAGTATHAASPRTPSLFLSYPTCLPSCTAADRPALMADRRMEDKVVVAIEGSKKTLDFATFTFTRPRILSALVDAAERGVRVRGLVDRVSLKAVGKACTSAGCVFEAPFNTPEFLAMSPRARFDWAEKTRSWPAGASAAEKLAIVLFRSATGSFVKPPPGAHRLMHDKFVLADGDVLVNGTPNFSSTGLAINLETLETATSQSDPEMVSAFACAFEAIQTGDPQLIVRRLPGCQTKRVFFTPMPALRGPLVEILKRVNEAKERIDIAMHHFTSPEITSALVMAAARGVKVRMVFDDDDCVARFPGELRTLAKAGAELRYLPTSCDLFQLQHDKFGVFDGARAISGPANWTKAGIVTNYENFVVYEDAAYVGAFSALFERVWKISRPREVCGCNPGQAECRQRFCLDREWPN
ncbi:MAG: phospholipase D-like domain-containing protein [Polyangiaceae bacterium]